MWTFAAQDGGSAYVARLEAAERTVLLDLVDDVLELLGGADLVTSTDASRAAHPLDRLRIPQESVTAPSDPALLRLLPDASRDDPAVASEFRRLTETDLREAKVTNLLRLRAVIGSATPEAVVVASEAAGVAAALTDVRLVLAERLELRTDEDADRIMDLAAAADDVEDRDAMVARFLATLYVMLTMLQESLVGLMVGRLPAAGRDRRGTGPAAG